ncbi:MAG: DUF4836 family protein [Muribaculaceae bacterium]|nr:DUF4836 family protein [Muribaculaceae bacterium]
MKKIYYLGISLILLVVSSCSSSNEEMLKMIPQDASFIGSIDTKSIVEKSGCKLEGNNVVFSAALDSLIGSKDLPKLGEIGLNLEKRAFFFGLSESIGFGLVCEITDADKLKSSLENSDKKLVVKEDKGFSYTQTGDEIIAFNDNLLIVVSFKNKTTKENQLKAISEMFNGTSKSIAENKDIVSSLDKDNDVVVYLNYDKLIKELTDITRGDMSSAMALSMMKGAIKSQVITLDFNKDNMELKCNVDWNKESEYYKLMDKVVKKVDNTDFLKFMPADVFTVYVAAIDGEELSKLPQIQALLTYAQLSSIGLDKSILSALATIDGTVSFGMSYPENYKDIKMVLAIQSKDAEKINALINDFMSMSGAKATKEGNKYVINQFGTYIEYGLEDGYFVLKTFKELPAQNAASDKTISEIFNKSNGGLYMGITSSNSQLTEMITKEIGENITGYTSVKAESVEGGVAKFVLTTPKGNNILETIIKIAARNQKINVDPIDNDSVYYEEQEPLEDIYE